jgi:hypothetical protein
MSDRIIPDMGDVLYTLADIKDYFRACALNHINAKSRKTLNKYAESVDSAMKKLMDADRVKVVRCEDCRYWEPENAEEGDTYGRCMNMYSPAGMTDMTWFCADGERGCSDTCPIEGVDEDADT